MNEPSALSMIHQAQERMLTQLEELQREQRRHGDQLQRAVVTLETFQRDIALIHALEARIRQLEDERTTRRAYLAVIGLAASAIGAIVSVVAPPLIKALTS